MIKKRVKLLALCFLGAGLAMLAWAGLLFLGLSMEQPRELLVAGAPIYLIIPSILVLAGATLATAIALLRRAEWSRPASTLLCLLSLLLFPVGTALGVFGLWALSSSRSSGEESREAEGSP